MPRAEPHYIRIEAVRLGSVSLLAIPGELFLELGEDIRRRAPDTDGAIVLGYANGYLGYLPTRAAFEKLSYEVLVTPVRPGSGEAVVRASLEALEELARSHGQSGSLAHG